MSVAVVISIIFANTVAVAVVTSSSHVHVILAACNSTLSTFVNARLGRKVFMIRQSFSTINFDKVHEQEHLIGTIHIRALEAATLHQCHELVK